MYIPQRKDFYNLGRFVAMSITQGGSGLPCLAEAVYTYFRTGQSTGISVTNEEIPDPTLRFICEKVNKYP